MRNRACIEVSNNIGIKPKKVVSVVNNIGLNLRTPDSTTASKTVAPFSWLRLIKSTKISESLRALDS